MKAIGPTIKSFLDMASMVVVTVAGAVVIWMVLFDGSFQNGGGVAARVSAVTGLRIEAAAVANVKGTGDVAIIEFSDYECPFCASYTRTVFPEIERELIEPGLIQYVVFNFPLAQIHPQAIDAAEAAECAARQGRFWEMHQLLFRRSPALAPADLVVYADELGLDRVSFGTCLANNLTNEKVLWDLAQGERFQVTATPSFFIGRIQEDGSVNLVRLVQGTMTFEELMSELSDFL